MLLNSNGAVYNGSIILRLSYLLKEFIYRCKMEKTEAEVKTEVALDKTAAHAED